MAQRRKLIHQSNKKTDKIIEQTKRDRLNDIFSKLLPEADQEGYISAQRIDLHSLQTDLLEVLSPLLCEMEELSTTLNREEFLDSALRLYNVSPFLTLFNF